MTLQLFNTAEDDPKPEPPEFRGLTEAAKRRLIAGGYLDAATGATRKARARRCNGCRRPIWVGIDADWCGTVREADPGPLGPIGEALARFYGWEVLQLSWHGTFELYRRDKFMLAGNIAGSVRNEDVLVAHICDSDSSMLPRIESNMPSFQSHVTPIDPPDWL